MRFAWVGGVVFCTWLCFSCGDSIWLSGGREFSNELLFTGRENNTGLVKARGGSAAFPRPRKAAVQETEVLPSQGCTVRGQEATGGHCCKGSCLEERKGKKKVLEQFLLGIGCAPSGGNGVLPSPRFNQTVYSEQKMMVFKCCSE